MNKIKKIYDFGQSIWLDFIDRKIMASGELQQMIENDGLMGMTSNPAIFEKAITSSDDYSADIAQMAKQGKNADEIYHDLVIKDIQDATAIFLPVYQKTHKIDGYVSLEVSPYLARNTQGTISEALQLWKDVNRENVMIKIPGTAEGIPAIKETIAQGLNVNVTLLFDVPRYEEVALAYIEGLEARVAQGLPIAHIASVASFFLSRIDVAVDPLLAEKGLNELKGTVAIDCAKQAYLVYEKLFHGERFAALKAQGAQPQRLLWASTGSKDPAFSDVKYVEALIGPETVNTVPTDTLNAYRDHGDAADRLKSDMEQSAKNLAAVQAAGIAILHIAQQLENEGIEKFNAPFAKLMDAIESERAKHQASN